MHRVSPSTLVSSCTNSRLIIRDSVYLTSRENSLELIELSSINKASLVHSCSNTGTKRMVLLDLQREQFRTDRVIQYK